MDTRYWGPSGWKLLHSITFSYKPEKKNQYKEFFYTIAFVLPCKFCRKSYSEYITDDPIDVTSKENFTKWLWRIHNKVNEKLRSQGLCNYDDPPFNKVKEIYSTQVHQECSKIVFQGWEFLFSIVQSHPTSKLSLGSKPFDKPENIELDTPLLRNMYNIISTEEKLKFYKDFWRLLPEILPFPEWIKLWKTYDKQTWDTRKDSLANLYSIRCSLEKEFEFQNRTNFLSLCKELRTYKSGCNKSKRSKTCRKK
jgi:Erv1 / Alr family